MFSAGTIEYSRMILLTQKLQSGSFILADLTARDRTLSDEQLDNIFLAIDQVVQPFDFATDGRAIVTSIGVDADDDAGGQLAAQRRGHARRHQQLRHRRGNGGAARRPRDHGRRDDDRGGGLLRLQAALRHRSAPRVIRRVAFFKPRLGNLDTLLP